MSKRYTRAQKRQIVQNLFRKRNFQFISSYVYKKTEIAIREWQVTQTEMKESIFSLIDDGIVSSEFFKLIKGYGWTLDDKLIENGLLEGYAEELEDLYPDTFQEAETIKELGPEAREREKEGV